MVQQILGHKRLESTAVYLHASLDDLMAVVEA
jgi:site-specific recombinase XerD